MTDTTEVIPVCQCCGLESDIAGEDCCLVCRCDEHPYPPIHRPTDLAPGCGPMCRYCTTILPARLAPSSSQGPLDD